MVKIGSVFANRYRIIAEIGRGGMGSIYKADDQKLGDIVALKLLLPSFQNNPEVLKRFVREIKLALRITHENVIRIYDIGESEGYHYISMEYIDGRDLKELIDEQGALDITRGVSIIKQVCAGLAAAHRQGVIHRDMKPQNILIQGVDHVKLADFGIAKFDESASTTKGMTKEGMVIGTPEYMSPEQALGKKVTFSTDIYSLGCIMYEMFTGSLPFNAETPMNILVKQIKEVPKIPSSLNGAIPLDLERIILRAMEKSIDKRYPTVDELLLDIEHFEQSKTDPMVLEVTDSMSEEGDTIMGELEVLEELSPTEIVDEEMDTETLYNKGLQLFNNRNFSDAINVFEKVLQKDPNHKLAYDYMEIAGSQIAKEATVSRLIASAERAFKEKNYAEAFTAFQKAAELSPDNPQVQVGLKKVKSLHQGPLPQTEPQKASVSPPEQAEPTADLSLYQKGKEYYEKKQFDKAIEVLQEALAQDSNDSKSFELLELAKAAFSSQQDTEHHFLTAKRLWEEGDKAAALQELQIALDYDPEHEGAKKLLRELDPSYAEQDEQSEQELMSRSRDLPLERKPAFKKLLNEVSALVKEKRDFDKAAEKLEAAKKTFAGEDEKIEGYIKRVRQAEKSFYVKEFLKKGKELSQQGNFRTAIGAFQKVLDQDPQNKVAKALIEECKTRLTEQRKQQEKSQKIKVEAIKKEAERPSLKKTGGSKKIIVILIIVLLLGAGAVGVFTQLPMIKEKIAIHYESRGDLAMAEKRYDDAVEAYTSAYDNIPNEAVQEKLGKALYHAGDYSEAKLIFRGLLKAKPAHPEYHYYLGAIASKRKDFKTAISEFKKVLAKNRRDIAALNAIGDAYLESQNLNAAAKYYLKSLQYKSEQPYLRMKLARNFVAAKRFNEAIAQYKKLIHSRSSLVEAHTELAELYLKLGMLSSAIEAVKKHPAYKAGSADIFYIAAESYYRLAVAAKGSRKRQYLKQSEEYYRKTFIIDMTYKKVMNKLTKLLMAQRRYGEAKKLLEQFVRQNPDNPYGHFELGNLLYKTNKLGPAYDQLAKATQLDENYVDAWNLLGRLHEKRGNKKDARIAYQKSLKADPTQKKIRWRLSRLR